jgi:hypothetical protein
MRWTSKVVGAQTYDLSHLSPASFEITWPPKGDLPEKRIVVAVEYSMHCFTTGLKAGQPGYVADLEYKDSREVRQFDLQRYEHSKLLPGLLAVFATGSQKCYESRHRNYFTSLAHPDGVTTAERFCIYFRLVKREKPDADLTLYIQSAYCKEAPDTGRVRPCSFKELCGRVLRK